MKYIYKITLSIAMLYLTINLNAQIKTGTVTIGSGSTQMDMTISMNTNTSIVSYSITGPSTRWFGYGFSASSMGTNAYTILANVGSNGNPKEYNQVYHAAPVLQSSQNLSSISNSSSGGFKTYTFTRAMNTSDANDFVFTAATSSISIIWAYGSSTTLGQHAQKGTSTITLSSICNIPTTVLPSLSICQGDSALIFGNYKMQAGTYMDTLTTSMGCDSVVSQMLSVNQPFVQQLNDTMICYGDSIQMFGNWIGNQGTYYDSLKTTTGCDSVYFINVSVVQIDTQVYVSNNQLNAAYAYADNYQWYNCQTNQAIAGANQLNYSPTANGSYKVEIFSLGCVETSSCHSVYWVGIDKPINAAIRLWPNPVKGHLLIEFPENQLNYRFSIYSIDGKKVREFVLNSKSNTLDLSTLETGMYIYQIVLDNKLIQTSRFIKE